MGLPSITLRCDYGEEGRSAYGERWTCQLLSIFAGLGVVLLRWFLYIKPLIHRRHRKAVSNLTRSWELKAE